MGLADLPRGAGLLETLRAALAQLGYEIDVSGGDGRELVDALATLGQTPLGRYGYRLEVPDEDVELPEGRTGREFLFHGKPTIVRWAVDDTGLVWGDRRNGPNEIAFGPDGNVWTGTWWADHTQTVGSLVLSMALDAILEETAAFGGTSVRSERTTDLLDEAAFRLPDLRNTAGRLPGGERGMVGDVLVRVDQTRDAGHVQAWADHESSIEALGLDRLDGWRWTSRRRMGTPDTDHVLTQRPRDAPATGGGIDLRELLARPPLVALGDFLQQWIGRSLPETPADPVAALAAVRALHREQPLWASHRLGRADESIDSGPGDLVFVLTDSQSTTAWAYGRSDLAGWIYDDLDGEWHPAGHGLDELLLQSVVMAGMEVAAVQVIDDFSHGAGDMDEVLAGFTAVRPSIHWSGSSSPAGQLLTDGVVLAQRWDTTVSAAAHDREAIARSSLRASGGWIWQR